MIFNEIKCHVNTSLGLVGRCIPPCVRACSLYRLLVGERTKIFPFYRHCVINTKINERFAANICSLIATTNESFETIT